MADHKDSGYSAPNARLISLQNSIGKHMETSVSPVGCWLNGKLTSVEEGSIALEFVVRQDMTNPVGVLHGGIAATMLDDVVGMMVYALGREFAYTSVNLNCDFLHAARLGDILQVSGRVIRAGKNIIHVEGIITNPEDKIVAKCTSNLIQTSFKIPF
jgi:acyl-coenzyme A thioesterase 13